METLLAIFLGLSLSVTCGFRVFVPLLVVSVGSWSGHITPAENFAWIGSMPALIVLSVATILETLAYLIPWLDHALDVLALPIAAIAGTMLTGGLIQDMSPFVRWSLAVVAGGGLAVGTHLTMATARAGTTATAGGLFNPLLSIMETLTAVVMSLIALVAPIVVFFLLLMIAVSAVVIVRRVARFVARRFTSRRVTPELA